jgi:ribose transport system permease protein
MRPGADRIVLIALQNMPLILFVAVFAIFGMLSPRFFEYGTLESIVRQASYIGIIAVGMTFVLLTAGIDLSVGANMYLSASVAGLLIQHYGVSVWTALAACLTVGLLFGCVNAFAVTKLRIIPFIVTLATLVAGRGVGLLLTKSRAVPYPESVLQIGSARLFGLIPMPIVLFALVVAAAYVFLKRTPMGRRIYAVGNDAEAARKAGINTDRVLATVYIICGVLAALGGFISVAQLGIVNAGFGEGDEFDAIAAAVLGGTSLFGGVGSVFPGTVLGALLIQMVTAGLVFTQVDLYLQPLVIAAIIFLAVFLDSVRSAQIAKLERRHIRVEESARAA